MRDVGIATEITPTDPHPVVYGEPLDLWESPPFEPVIRNGKIYGRGTSDNKAQLFTYLKTVETLRAVLGDVPVSLKFLYEGEEEIGSPSPEPFVEANRERLSADFTYCSDSHIHESSRPIVILGLKGMLYVELVARARPQTSIRCAPPRCRAPPGASSGRSRASRIPTTTSSSPASTTTSAAHE